MTDNPESEAKRDKVRLSLDLSREQNERLERLIDHFEDSPTKVQVIRRAIKLLEVVVRYTAGGATIQSAQDGQAQRVPLELIELYTPEKNSEKEQL